MSVDTELEAWRQQWQAEKPVSPDLSRKVLRHSRWMRVMLAVEIAITVIMGGGATVWAFTSGEPDIVVLTAAIWIFLAAAWIFGMRNRRGLWTPAALSTSAFLDISIKRCRSGLASSAFGTILYFCEIVFCLLWIYLHDTPTGRSPAAFLKSPVMIFVLAVTVVFLAGVLLYRRRKRRELHYLLALAEASDRD